MEKSEGVSLDYAFPLRVFLVDFSNGLWIEMWDRANAFSYRCEYIQSQSEGTPHIRYPHHHPVSTNFTSLIQH